MCPWYNKEDGTAAVSLSGRKLTHQAPTESLLISFPQFIRSYGSS